MFKFLVTTSLRHRLFVLAAAFILVAYGSFVLPRHPASAGLVWVFDNIGHSQIVFRAGNAPSHNTAPFSAIPGLVT